MGLLVLLVALFDCRVILRVVILGRRYFLGMNARAFGLIIADRLPHRTRLRRSRYLGRVSGPDVVHGTLGFAKIGGPCRTYSNKACQGEKDYQTPCLHK